jgi:hypothetical protein
VKINFDRAKELFKTYPTLPELLKSGYLRKYQIQDALELTKAETDMLVDDLIMAGVFKQTPFGYKMLVRVQKELEMNKLM